MPRFDNGPLYLLRDRSGKQGLDAYRRVAGGELHVQGCQRGVAGLGEGSEVVVGPQFVTLLVACGDRAPHGVQFVRLVRPKDALVRPELVEGPPGLAAVDRVVAHDDDVGQEPEQAHLSDPAEDQVTGLPAEPVRRRRMVRVASPDRGTWQSFWVGSAM